MPPSLTTPAPAASKLAFSSPVGLVPATAPEALARINEVEQRMRAMPQIELQTEHILHAGMYARTVRLAPRVAIVSVLIKVPTMLTVNGACRVYAGDGWRDFQGFNVIPASAGRKMIYVTSSATEITMVFPTKAKSVEEAEREFTDDPELLLSRQSPNDLVIVTGVEPGVEPGA